MYIKNAVSLKMTPFGHCASLINLIVAKLIKTDNIDSKYNFLGGIYDQEKLMQWSSNIEWHRYRLDKGVIIHSLKERTGNNLLGTDK